MNYLANSKKTNFFLFLLIFCASFYSYSINGFKVTSDKWFNEHQLDSEQLVLDGLINASQKDISPSLGKYLRNNENSKDYLNSREYFLQKNYDGEFEEYKSNYGLQVKLFFLLYEKGFSNLKIYYSITSILMSLIVCFMTYTVKRDFSLKTSIIFALIFILSPWIVVFSRNLFWVTFSWFLPILISMYLAPQIFTNFNKSILMSALIFLSFLFKFLCGYEFITTIFFATCVPIIYHGKLKKTNNLIIFKKCSILFIVFFLYFVSAVLIHNNSIKNKNYIFSLIEKRLWSNNPKKFLEKDCKNISNCKNEIYKSHKTNAIVVLSKYLLMADFLPWFYSDRVNDNERNIIKNSLKQINHNLSMKNIKNFFSELKNIMSINIIILFFLKTVSLLAFIFFVFFSLYSVLISNNLFKYYILFSLLSTLSWFIIAKGHSAIHLHVNFVLWYVTYIPSCIIFWTNNFKNE